MEETTKRKSGVELLRVIAIVLIVLSHSIQTMGDYINYVDPTGDYILITLKLLSNCGLIGNIIFVTCSSWFLCGKEKIKTKKAISILIDSSLISITILLLLIIFTNINFTLHDFFVQLLPDIYQNLWFIPTYVMFFLISPLLNVSLKILNEKTHLIFVFTILFLYGFLGVLDLRPSYCELLGFILTFYFVTYIKIYMNKLCKNVKINIIIFIILFVLYDLIIIYKNFNEYNNFYLINLASKNGTHIMDFFSDFGIFFNPIITPMIMSLFNIFNNINISSTKINKLASCSLFVYCIHENILLRTYIRTKYYEYMLNIYGYNNYFSILLSCFFGMLIGSFILALLYKETLHKFALYLSEKIENAMDKFFDKMVIFMRRFQ